MSTTYANAQKQARRIQAQHADCLVHICWSNPHEVPSGTRPCDFLRVVDASTGRELYDTEYDTENED